MPRINRLYRQVARNKNSPDTVSIEGDIGLRAIRFTAKHADHIVQNRNDHAHEIYFNEIIELIKNSIVIFVSDTKKCVALGKHNGKLYETYFYLLRDRIDVVTSFKCNKIEYQFIYKSYENGTV
jgi:hypothetical protein